MTEPLHTPHEDAALLAREPAEAAATAPEAHWVPQARRWPAVLTTGIAAMVALIAVLAMWRLPPFGGGDAVRTDDAAVHGPVLPLAAGIAGRVLGVAVGDYAAVTAGQVLAVIESPSGRVPVRAPGAGRLGPMTVARGAYVSAQSPVAVLVSPGRWVVAAFKEGDAGAVRVGQTALFTIDALPDLAFRGTVERIAPATDAALAAGGPDTALGSFLKVPQRIGVRIAITPGQPGSDRLKPGMSAEASVRTR